MDGKIRINEIGKKYKVESILPYHLYEIELNTSGLKQNMWYHLEYHANDAQSIQVEYRPIFQNHIHQQTF